DSGDKLSLEYLYRFYTLFNQIQGLLEDYGFINDLKSLQSLYDELLALETLDFTGEPLEGLQIMGMLESRNLDFETVILTSVNEGILPTGKTANSYIPFDLKLHHGLPTYKEKDAIYTYHFYRLLQRAKHIFILYTTQTNGLLGGEKSRLILQLQTDTALNHNITEKTAIPRLRASKKSPNSVVKNKDVLQRIAERAALGFSPTSLTTYIRNPMDFYKRSVMGLDDIQEVEENIAANTFGTVVHDTLEDLYRPFLGKFLTEMELIATKPMIEKCVRHHFGKSYPGSDISSGKNLIAFQVILKYIAHFIDLEIRELKRHRIKIIGLETKLETVLDIPEVGFPVVLKGKLDRIDEKDGLIRIIDYKTGTTTSSQVELWDWQTLITTYDHSKAFQLLCYALLYNSRTPIKNVHAGIIPFKNLSSGLLSFAIKPTRNSRKKERSIDQEVLQNFRVQLKKLILEICSADVPFLEKEI
ncbi:MAG: PD-(D/E)XK nuclease family protein, partial [Bacteroidota bacterium]